MMGEGEKLFFPRGRVIVGGRVCTVPEAESLWVVVPEAESLWAVVFVLSSPEAK